MNNKISIEFLGMPGTGKTFFQKLIIKDKKFQNYKIIKNDFKFLSKPKKIIHISLFILRYPFFFFETINLLYSSEEKTSLKKRYFYYFYNEIALRSYFDFYQQKCIYVNSEGFLYRTQFYFKKKFNKMKLINYLKKLPKVDVLILINSSKYQNIKRTIKRKKEYKYSKEHIKNYENDFQLLKKIGNFYNNKKTKYLIFNNKKNNIKKNLDNIYNLIN